jgi:predicted DNA-binding protein
MARNDPQMNIRIPSDLKEKIEKAKEASGRSMNAEIVHRLEASFMTDKEYADAKGVALERVSRMEAEFTDKFEKMSKDLDYVIEKTGYLKDKYGGDDLKNA